MNLYFKFLFFIYLVKSTNCFELDSNEKTDYVVKITSQTGDHAVIEGESIVLYCDVRTKSGSPPLNPGKIQFRWTFNGANLTPEPRKYSNHNQLIIMKTDYLADFGEYKCMAFLPTSNPCESAPYSLNIHWISKKAEIIHFKYPELDTDIDEPLQELPIEAINQFKAPFKLGLKCKALGYPELQIDWYLNDEQIIASNVRLSGSKFSVENNNLYIIGQESSVNGVYTCKCRNSVGNLESENSFVIKMKSKRKEQAMELKSLTSDQIVNKGQQVTLNCEFSNYDKIQWYSPANNLISNSSRTLISTNSSVLIINQVDKDDEGVYKCTAYRSDRKQQLQYSIRVQLAFIDEFASHSIFALYNHHNANTNLIVIPEKSKKFEVFCLTPKHSRPDANVYWLNPDNKVISNQGLIRVLDNHQLMFHNAQIENSGVYTCVAENKAAKRMKQFNIKVKRLPSLANQEAQADLVLKEHTNATLNCLESNSGDQIYYTISWYHNGTLITDDKRRKMNDQGQLVITQINSSDDGLYICKLNHTGYPTVHNAGVYLRVIEMLKFIQLPVDRRLEMNRPAKIHCRARTSIDSNNLKVKWLKGDTELLFKSLKLPYKQDQQEQHLNLNATTLDNLKQLINLNNLTTIKDENGYLIIKQMSKEFDGYYTCLAYTSQELIFTTIRLDSYVMPKFVKTPPETIVKTIEDRLQLDCSAYADAEIAIRWDKDNELIVNSSNIVTFQNGTLIIFNLTLNDQGRYGCMVGNAFGFIRSETNLKVKSFETLKQLNLLDTLDEKTFNSRIQKTVGLAIGIVSLYILIIIGLFVWFRLKRKSARLLQNEVLQSQLSSSNESSTSGNSSSANSSNQGTKSNSLEKCSLNDNLELKNTYQLFNQDLQKTSTYLTNDDGTQSSLLDANSIRSFLDPFNRKNLQQIMLLGNGEYGNVFLASNSSVNSPIPNQEQMAMVKSLQNTDQLIINEFNQEIEMFRKLSHSHIVKLLAVCFEQEPKLMVLEYTDYGDLKQYLLATRLDYLSTATKPEPLTKIQLLSLSIQITNAMNYLTSVQNFVHKDLAARNVLISSNLDVKLTSCSLSNDTYSKEYIKFRGRNLPLRWMPYESVFDSEYSKHSDVYSFAVLFWELIFSAELPYFELKDEQVFNLLKCKQLKLSFDQFDLFSNNLCDLLRQCLSYNPTDRPSFSTLNNALINDLNFING